MRKNRVQKTLAIIGLSISILFILLSSMYLLVYLGAFGSLPTKHAIKNITQSEASEIFSSDTVLLGRIFIQNRVNITTETVPENIINALIATEDVRFYNHNGIDLKSLVRVILKTIILQNESSGGGSTITQQLVKNTFPRKPYRFFNMPINKIREHILAVRFEKVYSKEEILSLYINTVSFGEDTYGLLTVAKRFFNKHPATLNIEEAAMLIGMLKSPYYYNPRNFYDKAMLRRNTVLSQMNKNGYITDIQLDSLQNLEINLNYQRYSEKSGFASYFRQQILDEVHTKISNLNQNSEKQYDLLTDGLKIYTTIDSKLQSYAESAVSNHMKNLQKIFENHWKGNYPWLSDINTINYAVKNSEYYKKQQINGKNEELIKNALSDTIKVPLFAWEGQKEKEIQRIDSIKHYLKLLHAGFIAIDPKNGNVKSWVGGINYQFFQYDHVRSKRPAGSTFKPIVYSAAIEDGISPCDFFSNDTITFPNFDNWKPNNANNEFGGFYSMKGALKYSVNTIAARLIMQTGIDTVIAMARKLGIEGQLDAVPSLALGTGDVSLLEMVTAYSAFVNGGKIIEPKYILRIEDRAGNILYQNKQIKHGEQAMTSKTSKLVLKMMEGVVEEGTGNGIRTIFGINGDVAGKTGTTQNQSDGWFIAITPDLITGAWVGGELPVIRFNNLNLGQASKTALPIVGKFLSSTYSDSEYSNWKQNEFDYSNVKNIENIFDCPDYLDEIPRKWFTPEYNLIKDSDTTNTNNFNNFMKSIKKIFRKDRNDE